MAEKISVCVIGFNEEKKIEDCLKSVKDVADEIIYVDSYSTDATIDIAKKYTNKIFKQKFLGHVQQKNFAVAKASHNWILSLDCDERLSKEAIEIIQKERDFLEKYSAYRFKRRTFYIYRWIYHSGWYPDYKIRLFRKDICSWQGENPHDKVECSLNNIKTLDVDILHYSFDSIDDHLKTIMSFSSIGAREAFTKGKKSGVFVIFFRSLWVGVRKIFFEFAFLDGVAGIIITGLSMAATWAKYSKLYVLQKEQKIKR